MGWLRFELPLEVELEVEKAARCIRNSTDLERVRKVAEECYRGWVAQADISRQLMEQLAAAEQRLAQYEPIDPKFLEWAQEITGQLGCEPPARGPLRALRSWFRKR